MSEESWASWAESQLTPLAARIVSALEPSERVIAPPSAPARDLEAELLERPAPPTQSGTESAEAAAWAAARQGCSRTSEAPDEALQLAQLRSDFSRLLQQREELRARLVVEQERRERAEAELVSIGAQWLGTETQEALQRRAEAERQRALDTAREALTREADERVARAQAETALLRERAGHGAPSELELQQLLRRALAAELAKEREGARAAVREQLGKLIEERDALQARLSRAEARHAAEHEMLRSSLQKASELVQLQFDEGFVSGLKQAASALGGGVAPSAPDGVASDARGIAAEEARGGSDARADAAARTDSEAAAAATGGTPEGEEPVEIASAADDAGSAAKGEAEIPGEAEAATRAAEVDGLRCASPAVPEGDAPRSPSTTLVDEGVGDAPGDADAASEHVLAGLSVRGARSRTPPSGELALD